MQYEIDIYKFQMQKQPQPYQLIGLASITFEKQIKITNLMIKAGRPDSDISYVSMPQYNSGKLDENKKPIYNEYCHPTNRDFREQIFLQINDQFNRNEKHIAYELDGQLSYNIDLELFKKFSNNIQAIASINLNLKDHNQIKTPLFKIQNIFIKQSETGFYLSYPAIQTSKQNSYQPVVIFKDKYLKQGIQNHIFRTYRATLQENRPFV